VDDAVIRNNRPIGDSPIFVGVSGKNSKGIILKDNYLGQIKKTVEFDSEVNCDAVKEINTIR